MKQLEREQPVGGTVHLRRRHGKIQCRLGDVTQARLQPIALEEAIETGARDIGQALELSHGRHIDRGEARGQVQTTVRGQALAYGLAHGQGGRTAPRTRVQERRHQAFTTRAP